MRLRLPSDQQSALRQALRKAGSREIGGQMFGEQLGPSDFRVLELTFQRRPGTFARFVVDLIQAARDAAKYFDRTRHRYARYNYIGEWHSHPSFAVRPSGPDLAAMRGIVMDREFRGHFAVLMIARLDEDLLRCGAWLFDPSGHEFSVALEQER